VGFLQNCTYYKTYKEVYDSLPNKKFYRNGHQVYDFQGENDDNGFVYFTNDKSFRLNKIVYMHSDSAAVDFYHMYWRKKFVKWFDENVKIDELPEFTYFELDKEVDKYKITIFDK
jgi:hypothetical protein